jgi:hypothetical protein
MPELYSLIKNHFQWRVILVGKLWPHKIKLRVLIQQMTKLRFVQGFVELPLAFYASLRLARILRVGSKAATSVPPVPMLASQVGGLYEFTKQSIKLFGFEAKRSPSQNCQQLKFHFSKSSSPRSPGFCPPYGIISCIVRADRRNGVR